MTDHRRQVVLDYGHFKKWADDLNFPFHKAYYMNSRMPYFTLIHRSLTVSGPRFAQLLGMSEDRQIVSPASSL